MFEDQELQDLFRAESKEYLQSLETGLLALENSPNEDVNLEKLFRDAHSLKGAARIMGFLKVETLAHQMEDRLRSAHQGKAALGSQDVTDLLGTLDALKDKVFSSLDDTGAETSATDTTDAPNARSAENLPPDQATAADSTDPTTNPDVSAPIPQSTSSTAQDEPSTTGKAQGSVAATTMGLGSQDRLHIDTLRVQTKQLDSLMTHSGELLVARTHLGQNLQSLRKLLQHEGREIALKAPDLLDRLNLIARGLAQNVSKLDAVSLRLSEEVSKVRMLPLATLFDIFPRMIRDLAQTLGKDILFEIDGDDIRVDKHLLEELKSPLTHLLRNAVDHGLESREERVDAGKDARGKVLLHGSQQGSRVCIEVIDDGRGLNLEKVRKAAVKSGMLSEHDASTHSELELQELIFRSGLTTHETASEISGRGVGLDVVRRAVDGLKGNVSITAKSGQGTCFRMELPLTLATSHIMLAKVRDDFYGFPIPQVERICRYAADAVFHADGAETVIVEDQPLSLVRLSNVLGVPGGEKDPLNCIVVRSGSKRLAVVVDSVDEQLEVVVKPIGALIHRISNFSGSAILPTGEICLVMNIADLIRGAQTGNTSQRTPKSMSAAPESKKSILLVEDSLITRVQERRILEGAGYSVEIAVDGKDALSRFAPGKFSAIVTDINMPNMDGFELTQRIRQIDSDIPIIIVTTLSDSDDRQRGMELGANAYIPKGTFEQSALLEVLERLIGHPAPQSINGGTPS